MHVQINDCTIRDGGYLLGKDSPSEFVTEVFGALLDAGIDVVEIGFLQSICGEESLVYRNSLDAKRHLPEQATPDRFTGFCDNSRYSLDDLDQHSGDAFDYLKISFAHHEADEALAFVAGAKEKGYKVLANPMDAPSYTADERSEMIAKINEIAPYCFSIVDTFGTMHLEDLEEIFCQIDRELNPSIRIGLHSHNNLQLSTALAERMIDLAARTDRDVIVDASLFGMGRGAGNASTEALAAYLNARHGASYDLKALYRIIDERIAPLLEKVTWGYDLPMLTCGTLRAHVDNVFHMREMPGVSPVQMHQVISKLDSAQRKRYGTGYSKTDFSVLDKVLKEISGGDRDELR